MGFEGSGLRFGAEGFEKGSVAFEGVGVGILLIRIGRWSICKYTYP